MSSYEQEMLVVVCENGCTEAAHQDGKPTGRCCTLIEDVTVVNG